VRIFLSGGEKGSHRTLLLSSGVTRVAVNLTQLAIPKRKEFSLPETFPGCEVLLYTSEGDEDVHRYDEFIRAHHDDLTLIIGRSDYDGEWLGAKYVPVWNDGMDLERLAWICQKSGRVAISDKAINNKTLGRIRSLSQRWGTQLVGLTSKPDVIEALPWDTVIVSSWTSVIRYGETQVWDGHGLRRYPAQQKESARRKHRSDIIRLGIDIDAIMEDNVQEVGRLAIKSWQQWEARNVAYDPSEDSDEDEFSTAPEGGIVAIAPETHTGVSVDSGSTSIATHPPKKRHDSVRQLLPVMGIEQMVSIGSKTADDQGEYTEVNPETVPVIRHSSALLRQCDSCYLASRCPAFEEHAECGFQLPVEIRTKDQLQAALRALLEMQVSRVLFARFAEELEGQGLDPTLSKEIDRMFDLVEKFKDISDTREMVRMEIETRSGGGVLSRLFGARAGEVARELPGGVVPTSTFDAMALDIIDMDDDS
jgi:hypothetical protein